MTLGIKNDIESLVSEALKDYSLSESVVIIVNRDKSVIVNKRSDVVVIE